MRPRILLLLCTLLMVSALGAAPSLGISPSAQDFGTVERGEVVTSRIFMVSDVDSPFRVSPEAKEFLHSTLFDRLRAQISPSEVSEESVVPWITFESSSGRIDPAEFNPAEYGLPNQSGYVGAVTYQLQVPQDAEPGYHAARISLNPNFNPSGGGTVVRAVADYRLQFRVPGSASRDIRLQNVRSYRTGQEEARIDVLLQNTGSVTSSISNGSFRIFDAGGRVVHEFPVGYQKLSPGESFYITETWAGPEVEGGNYRIAGAVDYRTGRASINQRFSLPQAIEVIPASEQDPNTTQTPQDTDGRLPAWLIGLALILAAILLYSFDVDPVWIGIIIGGLGIAAFIVVSNVPVYVLFVLMVVGIGTYYII